MWRSLIKSSVGRASAGGQSVTDAARATLRNVLVNNCMSLGQRLTRGLVSPQRASVAFEDPRSSPHGELDAGGAQMPGEDVLRLALNIAADQRRAGARKLAPDE